MSAVYETLITTWNCSCHPEDIPLAQRSCPHCHVPMPKKVRKTVYRQVYQELQAETLAPRAQRWLTYSAVSLKFRPLLRLITFCMLLAWVIVTAICVPQIFTSAAAKIATVPDALFQHLNGRFSWEVLQPIWDKLQQFSLQNLPQKGLTMLSAIIRGLELVVQRILTLVELVKSFVSPFLS